MFCVTWIQEENFNTRLYSKREYAERLINWCKLNKYKYYFCEETIDREILAYDISEIREVDKELDDKIQVEYERLKEKLGMEGEN